MNLKTLLFLLLFPVMGFSQSAERWNTALIPKGSGSNFASVIPNAKVYVCVYNSQLACNAPQPIYTDPTLTSTLTQPITAAGNGVYQYYIQSGTRVVEKVCAPYNQCSFYEVYVGSSGGGSSSGCTPSSPSAGYFVYWNGTQCVTGFVDEGATSANTTTTTDQNITLNATNTGSGKVIIDSAGEDGIILCTDPTLFVNCPTGGSGGTITLDAGTGIFMQAKGSVQVDSAAGFTVDDVSVEGVQLNSTGGPVEFSANGSSDSISIDAQHGISLSDAGSIGISIDSNTGPIALGGADLFIHSSATPGSGTNFLTINSAGLVGSSASAGMTWPAAAGIPCYSGSSSWCTSYSNTNTIPSNYVPTLNQNTTGYAAAIAGGALGSLPYQSAVNTTLFLASPTTNGHAFVHGWNTSTGSATAPTIFDLGTYLGANIGQASPIVVTPSTLGVTISCPTCGTAGGGTSLGVNGGGTLGSANLNATSPVADANYLALLPKISGDNIIVEAPYGTSSGFGVLECGSGTTCSGGVITVTGSGFPITIGSTSIAASSTTTVIAGLTIDGVTPTIMVYLDATSSIQTQLNAKQASLGYTPAHSGANSDISSLSGLSTPLSAPQGGLGAASLTGYIFGNGSSAATASATIPGSSISGNIAGNAANLSGTPTLPNGTSATTQAVNDNTTKLATTAYVKSPGIITPTAITLSGTGPTTVGMPPTTFSVLSSAYPCASNTGRIATVSDSTTQTWGSAYTGGGALFAAVVCDGSSYTVWGK